MCSCEARSPAVKLAHQCCNTTLTKFHGSSWGQLTPRTFLLTSVNGLAIEQASAEQLNRPLMWDPGGPLQFSCSCDRHAAARRLESQKFVKRSPAVRLHSGSITVSWRLSTIVLVRLLLCSWVDVFCCPCRVHLQGQFLHAAIK